MIVAKTRFDGRQIALPPELHNAMPGDVVVVYEEAREASGASIWDVVGKAERPRTAADIDAQIRVERDSWDDR